MASVRQCFERNAELRAATIEQSERCCAMQVTNARILEVGRVETDVWRSQEQAWRVNVAAMEHQANTAYDSLRAENAMLRSCAETELNQMS